MSPRATTAAAAAAPPTLVERTDLPRIIVRVKGAVKYYAYVNAYICGPKIRVQGTEVTPLYYLSLVGMHGHGPILEGIWSALVASTIYDVYVDGLGTVVLAHRQPSFASLGYSIHWNYSQVELPNGDLHRVIESNMLTMYDPLRGAAPIKRERRGKKGRRNLQKKTRGRERAEGSTATRKNLGELEEIRNREKHPLFLLLVPGNEQPERLEDESDEDYCVRCQEQREFFLAETYFAFLDMRAPWAMALEWESYLWERGKASRENVPLTVWNAPVHTEEEGAQASPRPPIFAEAWLCRPNVGRLDADLKDARRAGRISNLKPADEPVDERVPVLA